MSAGPRDLASPSRRALLRGAALAGGALLVGFHLPLAGAAPPATVAALAPNAFIRIGRAGPIALIVPYVEMGQGAYTAQAQLIAEELEVGLDQVVVEHAPPDEKQYSHPLLQGQITGGSVSLPGAYEPLRRAGATARILLTQAAAKQWRVEPSACAAQRGEIRHAASGRRATYGELAAAAATLPMPETVVLKPRASFSIIGKPVKRVDTPAKVDGTAKFGIDAMPDGVKFAAVAASPVFGGTLRGVDDAAAKRVRGVTQVVQLDDTVAVIATNTWAARKGLAALNLDWDDGANASLDTAAIVAKLDARLDDEGVVASSTGDFAAAQPNVDARYEATFRLPMLAHAALEPINCTAHVTKTRCEVWVGCQSLGRAQRIAAETAGLPLDQVVVHNHLLGGGFGRRLEVDYVGQAVRIARQVDGPVKVTWSREEDIQQDYFRFHNHSRIKVGIGADGKPLTWHHRLVGPAVMARFLPHFFGNGVDYDQVDAAASMYELPNARVEFVREEAPAGLHTGNWRGVGATRNAFMVESVIDDLAARARQDPVAYRRALLDKAPRLRGVLDLAVAKADWSRRLPARSGRGVAVLHGFGSYMAQVAEVTVGRDGRVRLDRVVCAVDCGVAVNPDVVRAQVEGGIVFGLSAMLYGRVTVAKGRVQQSNYHDYPIVRIHEAPRIDVHIVDSDEAPGGIGEPGTAAIMPAMANAIFNATGKRLFTLPIDAAQLRET